MKVKFLAYLYNKYLETPCKIACENYFFCIYYYINYYNGKRISKHIKTSLIFFWNY